jgi:hypothetical protein
VQILIGFSGTPLRGNIFSITSPQEITCVFEGTILSGNTTLICNMPSLDNGTSVSIKTTASTTIIPLPGSGTIRVNVSTGVNPDQIGGGAQAATGSHGISW